MTKRTLKERLTKAGFSEAEAAVVVSSMSQGGVTWKGLVAFFGRKAEAWKFVSFIQDVMTAQFVGEEMDHEFYGGTPSRDEDFQNWPTLDQGFDDRCDDSEYQGQPVVWDGVFSFEDGEMILEGEDRPGGNGKFAKRIVRDEDTIFWHIW